MSEKIDQLLQDAVECYIQRDWMQAQKAFEKVLTLDLDNHEANAFLGSVLVNLENYPDALARFEKVKNIDPPREYFHGEWGIMLNDWGRALAYLEQFGEATQKFANAVKYDPSSASHYYYNWGYVLERQVENPSRYAEAAEQYEAAVKADETYTDAWNGWGRVLIELQKYDEAIEKFKKAIELDPKYKYAYYNWALVLERQGEYTRAAEHYEATVKADETYTDAWNDWGRMLTDLKRYDEAIEKFRKAVELDPKYKIGYYNWGLALEWQDVKPKRYKEAIELYEKSIHADPQYIIAHNALGLAYLNVGQYSQADLEFRQIIELDPTSAFGYHNLAFILEKQGKYKQAQEMWEKALHVYDDIPVAKKIQSDWRFLGEISFYYFQNYARSIEYLEEGLKRFPDSLELLSTYLTLSLELKEQYAYEAPQALELIASAYWKAFDGYQKAVKLLEQKLEKDKAEDSYVSLGRLYVTMKNYSDAEDKLKDAIKLNNSIAEAHNLLGLIKTMRGDYSEAVQDFQNALKYNPDDFGIMSNLAEVYRKSERFDDAEKIYQRILSIAPSHMDSLIGLGETYAAMGDAAKEGSHAADAEMMYTQAIQSYSKALKYEEDAKNNKHGRFTEASKRLKTQELNAVYYSQGYARVSLYDAQSRKSDLLLLQARNDFRKVTKYPADENYHKARRAIKKVMEKLNPASTQNLEQRTGPVFISLLAFTLFVISLFTFIRGRPEVSSPGFALTGQSVEILQAANIPPEAAADLEGLVGKEFTTQEGLLAAIELVVGEETYAAYEEVLLAQPFEEPSELVWKPIETGYLALMAFGSLIFMVAGLYLQQISKLKFGSIEIEKSAVSQISSSGVLGIKK